MIDLQISNLRSIAEDANTSEENDRVAEGILRAVAYADIFDFPLTAGEIHRFLIGIKASPAAVMNILSDQTWRAACLSFNDGFFTLPGREKIIVTRSRRSRVASRMYKKAIYYGKQLAGLPFVRMVALTGALAVANVEESADIDFLVITEPGRLWLCRAFAILLVRRAALQGDIVCPNYFLSTRALQHPAPNLYSAHEMAQMIPIYGEKIYRLMWQLNPWVLNYLPNVEPLDTVYKNEPNSAMKTMLEKFFSLPYGSWLDTWEMKRKTRKFSQQDPEAPEAEFCADWCKGHFDRHQQRTLETYAARLVDFGVT